MMHIQECRVCRERVSQILEGDRFLLDRLADALHPERMIDPEKGETCFETKDLWDYTAWRLSRDAGDERADSSPEKYSFFDDHINECDRCLKEFRRIRKIQSRLRNS